MGKACDSIWLERAGAPQQLVAADGPLRGPPLNRGVGRTAVMASNETPIREFYANAKEEHRLTGSRAGSLEFHYTKKLVSAFIDRETSLAEIGCGTGCYGVYFADKCKEYLGVDISPELIEVFQRKIDTQNLSNVKAIVGDGTRLDGIDDGRFDVVMALGPFYHLPADERDLAFSECKRICRHGGIILIAYVNKIGAYVRGCLELPERYPDKELSQSVLKEGMSDDMPGLFYMTMPEEIEAEAKSHGLKVLRHAGVDFVFNEKTLNAMNDEQFAAWIGICDCMCDSQACAGLSNHALMVCRNG